MEVAGLAIGAVGLGAQLAKASIDCYNIFSQISEVGSSQDSILHELRTEALRLRQWEQGWNIGQPTATSEGQQRLDPNDVRYRYALASLARIVAGFATIAELQSPYTKELKKLDKSGKSKRNSNTLSPATIFRRITRSRSKSPLPVTIPGSSQASALTQKLSELKFWENPKSLENPQSVPGFAEEIASLGEVAQSAQQALSVYRKLHWVLADKERSQEIVSQLRRYIDGLFNVLPVPSYLPPTFLGRTRKKLELSFKIPFKAPNVRRDTHFVQREHFDKLLRTEIDKGKGTRNINQIVLYGTGGMGKTQLALNYVSCYHRDYSFVFWVNAASEQSVRLAFTDIMQHLVNSHAQLSGEPTPDYTQIAQLLGMSGRLDAAKFGSFTASVHGPADEEHVIEAVKRWLAAEGNPGWLLVFDNLDDLESFDINNYLPSCWHGTIIITSRRPESRLTRRGMEVQQMQDCEAQMLLLQSSHRELNEITEKDLPPEKDAIAAIAKKLGYLPLALDHAGSFILREQCTFCDYFKQLEENITFHLSKTWKLGRDEQSVFASWEMSYEVLTRRFPKAAELLSICGFLDNEDIAEEILWRGMELEENDSELRESIQALFSYSFAKRKLGNTSFYIHPLVHMWARERLQMRQGAEGLYSQKLSKVLQVISSARGHCNWLTKSATDWDFERRLMPHILAIDGLICKLELAMDNTEIFECIESSVELAEIFWDHGMYNMAMQWYRRALAGKEKQLGADHLITLTTVHDIALVFCKQGKYEMALQWHQRALAGREKQLGADHPDTLDTVHNMASVFHNQGKDVMALEWYQRALAGQEKLLGADHLDTLDTVHEMAVVYSIQGKYDLALEWDQRTLAGQEKQLGADHPETLDTLHYIAVLFYNQGKYDLALECNQQALAGREKQLGADHPDTLDTVHNMASVVRNQGKDVMALEWYQRALAGREKHLGADHLNTLDTVHEMAVVFGNQGKYELALEWYQRALDGREKHLGADHPDTLDTVHAMAEIRSSLARDNE